MRWDELALYAQRPQVRHLARSDVPPTPSRPTRSAARLAASFLLGQYSHNHRVYSHEEPYGFGAFDDHLTVGTALNQAGYETALVGKYLNGYGKQPSRSPAVRR